MASFHFTNEAIKDLNGIWNYTLENWSEQQADLYYRLLLNRCKNISVNPTLGKPYFEILPNLFGLKVKRHIIFYRIVFDENIEISRILHERMDLSNRIRE